MPSKDLSYHSVEYIQTPEDGLKVSSEFSQLPRRILNEAKSSAVFTFIGRVLQSRAALQANELWYFVAKEICVVVGNVGTLSPCVVTICLSPELENFEHS